MGISDIDNLAREGVFIGKDATRFVWEGSIGGKAELAQILKGDTGGHELRGTVQEEGGEEEGEGGYR